MLLTFAIIAMPVAVHAGDVYGRVIEKTRTFVPGDSITISGADPGGNFISVSAVTDKEGRYKISLPSGSYRVTFERGNRMFEAWIQSFPQPTQQNIVLFEVKK